MNTATTAPAAAERAEAATVSFTVAEQIAWVKFNRPEKRNCMSPKLNRQMMRVLDELEFRADVGVLVGGDAADGGGAVEADVQVAGAGDFHAGYAFGEGGG